MHSRGEKGGEGKEAKVGKDVPEVKKHRKENGLRTGQEIVIEIRKKPGQMSSGTTTKKLT